MCFFGQRRVLQKVGCITTFLHSINATRESNESGRFSARLGLAKLMPGREIKNVVFLGNTEIFEERKDITFSLLLRPTYMQSRASLAALYLNFVGICSQPESSTFTLWNNLEYSTR